MKKYISYLENISVDTQLHERTMKRLNQKPSPLYKNRVVYRYIGLAACLAIVLICTFTIPNLFNKPIENTPSNPYNPGEIDSSLVGLPVENFSLSDIQMNVEMNRIGYSKLSGFFSHGEPRMFAFVRVVETKPWEDKDPGWGNGSVLMQESSLYIISNLWSRDDDIPEVISLSQSFYGGCEWGIENGVLKGSETTNLLRKDGVYLLPLGYWQDNDRWYIMGDLDVLFEIDDKGRVWTHSKHEDFNRFDGENAEILTDTVTAFTSDENFLSATTTFGQIARGWGILTEVTVASVNRKIGHWESSEPNEYIYYEYIFNIDNFLSTSLNDNWYIWLQKSGDKTTIISYDIGFLEPGKRYLIFLESSYNEGRFHIRPAQVSKINDDGTITAIPSVAEYMPYTNVFDEFNGYTVGQMKEEAERAKTWHENYAKK